MFVQYNTKNLLIISNLYSIIELLQQIIGDLTHDLKTTFT
jgi:hypothetical protein